MINKFYAFIRANLVKLLKDNNSVLSCYNNLFYLKNHSLFWKKITDRAKLDIFEYRKLSKPIPFLPLVRIKDANFYSLGYNLKRICKLEEFPYTIEHGLYFGNYIPIAHYYKTTTTIFTLSNFRKEIINKNINKKVITIGPYIHYSEQYYPEEKLKHIKSTLGKTLLFFPSHSTNELMIENDTKKNIDQIKNEAKRLECQTVLVNIFYFDIIHDNKCINLYTKAGFKIVTAGHRLDLNFMPRLKSIITLSDYTMSNSVGTHIGYCIYLNKPHQITKSYVSINKSDDYEEILKIFRNDKTEITKEQYNIAAKYWGFNDIKTKEEILELINNANQ